MKLWLDAQLPPSIAVWIEATFDVEGNVKRGRT